MLTRTAVMITALIALVAACAGPTATSPGDPSVVDERSHAECALGPRTAPPGVPWQDRPGIYEPEMLPAAMDAVAGRIVVLQPRPTVIEQPVTWTFDVCRNRWQRMGATLAPDADVRQLVYHEAADLTLGIPGWEGPVRAYSFTDDTWTDLPSRGEQPSGITDVVYDPDSGLVIAWSDRTSGLWTFEITTGTWTQVERGARDPWPDIDSQGVDERVDYTLMTFDTVLDAVLLVVLPIGGRPGSTWTLDGVSRTWTDLRSSPPTLMLGYGELGSEIAYDSAHGTALLTAGGDLTVFDSETAEWARPSPEAWGGLLEFDTTEAPWTLDGLQFLPWGLPIGLIARSGHTVVYDPANERVVLLGGSARMIDDDMPTDFQIGWWLTADVWAYDVGDNTWIQLVPEQDPRVMAGTYRPTGQ